MQTTVVSADGALALVAAARDAAEAAGARVSIAVCDTGGVIRAFLRMDGAPLGTVKLAQAKAVSAVTFGTPTTVWNGMDAGLREGVLHGLDGFTTLGGGVPLVADGALIGGLGVSGGTVEQDNGAALAAATSVLG